MAPDEAMEIEAGNGRAGPPPKNFNGTDGARSKHSALARREYNLLALKAS